MKGYNKIRKTIINILEDKLSEDLRYHGIHHTLNALQTCDLYLRHLKVSKHEAQLLRLGILLHDIGFTESNEDHEYRGSLIARDLLAKFDFDPADIEIIVGLILSTKIPQKPKTLLEKLICDIDLDYLGLSDYYKISDDLFYELQKTTGLKNKNDWIKIQVQFLEAHQFHTDFAIKNRQPEKEKRLEELRGQLQ